MKIKLDIEKLNNQGFFSHDHKEFFERLKSKIDWLESHNKNYTKQQYFFICDLQAFLKSLEIEDDKEE